MSISYVPAGSTYNFVIPKTLESDFDNFLNYDIPNSVMDFEILHDWYSQFESNYVSKYIRGEMYPNTTKSRYENMDNFMNLRVSLSSGILKGDILKDPSGNIWIVNWNTIKEHNNIPTQIALCNTYLTFKRFEDEVTDDRGFLITERGYATVCDSIPSNAYRYDGRPEFTATSNAPGISGDALTIAVIQYNDITKNIKIGDYFKWADEPYIVIDIDRVGMDISNTYGVLKIQAKKAPGDYDV